MSWQRGNLVLSLHFKFVHNSRGSTTVTLRRLSRGVVVVVGQQVYVYYIKKQYLLPVVPFAKLQLFVEPCKVKNHINSCLLLM